jgi:hypothetical protein
MSFEEYEDCFVWRCNGKDCGKEVVFPPTDFYGRVAELRARGWLFSLVEETGHEGWGRTWTHYCQHCRAKRQQTIWMDRHFSKPREVKG